MCAFRAGDMEQSVNNLLHKYKNPEPALVMHPHNAITGEAESGWPILLASQYSQITRHQGQWDTLFLSYIPIIVKTHHDQGNLLLKKHLIGDLLTVSEGDP